MSTPQAPVPSLVPRLSYFFPAHNEEANLEALVAEALETLPTLADTFEIIAVDDGSKDGTPALADDFYVNVRCGLLHEARTKGSWLIHAVDPTGQNLVVNSKKKIIYRDNFQDALLRFVIDYGTRLQTDLVYQEAFIRKFDSLIK